MELIAGLLVAVGFAFAWSIGAHYTGACMGMPYAAGAIRLAPALLLMAPLAFLGAALASEKVETTVGVGILPPHSVPLGVGLAIVTSAFALTTIYNAIRLPTSTIQILVFSVVGAGLSAGLSIDWGTIGRLLVLWAIAPVAAAGLAFGLLRARDRTRAGPSGPLSQGVVVALVSVGAAASFTMGANDVSNASGALVMTGLFGLLLAAVVGGIGISLGVLTWGRPLLRTVAHDIVTLDPRMAILAQLAQSGVVLASVLVGYFTSLNQALVGAMIGVGLARKQRTMLKGAVRPIMLGWIVASPSGIALGFALTRLVSLAGLGG